MKEKNAATLVVCILNAIPKSVLLPKHLGIYTCVYVFSILYQEGVPVSTQFEAPVTSQSKEKPHPYNIKLSQHNKTSSLYFPF